MKFYENLPNLFYAFVMLSYIIRYFYTRSGSNFLNTFPIYGSEMLKFVFDSFMISCKCYILCPSYINFLLSDYFFNNLIFSIIFWKSGTISSVASIIITLSFKVSFFCIFPNAFVTSYRKLIVGNYYRKCNIFLNIFLVA